MFLQVFGNVPTGDILFFSPVGDGFEVSPTQSGDVFGTTSPCRWKTHESVLQVVLYCKTVVLFYQTATQGKTIAVSRPIAVWLMFDVIE